MSKAKKTAPWRIAVEGLPHARYLLSEAKPQDFNHVAFLSFEKPASHKRRALTNAWLDQVIPGLKESDRQELREAGNRLTTEWTSKEVEREEFWNDLIRDEKEQQAKKDRMEFLKAAGEQRLRSAERYLVAETRIDFGNKKKLQKRSYLALDSCALCANCSKHSFAIQTMQSSRLKYSKDVNRL